MTESLTGAVVGLVATATICGACREVERRLHRASLGVVAEALAESLRRLEASITEIALDPCLLSEASQCRELAAAVSRLSK